MLLKLQWSKKLIQTVDDVLWPSTTGLIVAFHSFTSPLVFCLDSKTESNV